MTSENELSHGRAHATLDLLNPLELDHALALSRAEGWNQTREDWWRLIQFQGDGCFGAHVGTELVGTVTTTIHAGEVGWIGMAIVAPAHRGRGVGRALLRRALDFLRARGVRRIGLDATPAGRPLYEALGFEARADVERWQGVTRPPAHALVRERVRPETAAMIELDAHAWGASRARVLERLLEDRLGEPVGTVDGAGALEGFALTRAGRVATYVGPLIARTPQAAENVLCAALEPLSGTEVCLDLALGSVLDRNLPAPWGLSRVRGLTRMMLGPPPDARAMRRVCASAGPEIG